MSILAWFVSDWAAAKWETRQQETYLCQWQDRGSGVVSMCVLTSLLKRNICCLSAADPPPSLHLQLKPAFDPTLIDLLLCSVQMQNVTICLHNFPTHHTTPQPGLFSQFTNISAPRRGHNLTKKSPKSWSVEPFLKWTSVVFWPTPACAKYVVHIQVAKKVINPMLAFANWN